MLGLSLATLFGFLSVKAAFREEINYQGKLTDSNNIPVGDGSFNFRFRLCATSDCSGGSDPLWTETHCYSPDSGTTCDGTGSDQRVSVSSGLFSVMLGSISSLSSVDFNDELWLEVQVGGSASTPSWETLTPRKEIGTVPTAMVAKSSLDRAKYDIVVDAAGGGDYTTIASAISGASAGDSIFIAPGTYSENITIDKKLFNILQFVDQQNKNKYIVSYKDVRKKFSITKVTTAKRITDLNGQGLVIIKKKGRLKTIYVTNKGKRLLQQRNIV